MDALHELFQHHAWATMTLIDHCAGLRPEQLQATAPGTAGTIYHTLVHLVAADGRYLYLLTGRPQVVRESAPPSIAELRDHFAAQIKVWESVLNEASTLDVTIPARGDTPDIPHATNLLLVQALHHGNDHRTHICTILGAGGQPTPDLSGWGYWAHTHLAG